MGVVGKSDAEDEMVRFPWDILRYEYPADSHGAGRWRGAPGVIREAFNEGGDCHLIGGSSSGFHTQGLGQQGGEPTPLNKAYILRGNERIEIIEMHISLDLKAGDHLVTLSGGGAGVGRPEREIRMQ